MIPRHIPSFGEDFDFSVKAGGPVFAARWAGVDATMIFAEQENARATWYHKLLKTTEEELGHAHFELTEMKRAIVASETARKHAETKRTLSEEKRSAQMSRLNAELGLHREDADLQRQRAEATERLQHRLETGISRVVVAIAGVAIPGVNSMRDSNSREQPELKTMATNNPISFLGKLRVELGDARVTAQAAVKDLLSTRAAVAIANRRVDLANIASRLAMNRALVAEYATEALAAESSKIRRYDETISEVTEIAAQATFASSIAASNAAVAGLRVANASCASAVAQALDHERAQSMFDFASISTAMACRKAIWMMASVQRSTAADVAIAVAAQGASVAVTGVVQSRLAVKSALIAATTVSRNTLCKLNVAIAESRFKKAEWDAFTSRTLVAAHVLVAEEATKMSARSLEHASAVEASLDALRFEHDRSTADVAVTHAQLAEFHVACVAESMTLQTSACSITKYFVRELSIFERWVSACIGKWLYKLTGTQRKLMYVETHILRRAALLRRINVGTLERAMMAERDAANVHSLYNTGYVRVP